MMMFASPGSMLTTTWAAKPATYPVGLPVFITDAGTKGSTWFYDGSRWKPVNGVCTLASLDSASSSINNTETIVFQYRIPAGMWQVSDRVRVWLSYIKSGATDAGAIYYRIGTAGTTSDQLIIGVNTLVAVNRQIGLVVDTRLEALTSARMLPVSRVQSGYGGQGSSIAWDTAQPVSNAGSNALYFNLGIASGGATNTVQLVDAQLQLIAKAN